MQSSGRVEGNRSEPVSSKMPMARMVASSGVGVIPSLLRISIIRALLDPYSLLNSMASVMSSVEGGWWS